MPPPDPLTLAFPDRPDLRNRAHAAIAHTPSLSDLFTSIATYISTLRASSPHPNAASNNDNDRTAKKRKLEHENGNGLAARTKAGADDIGADWQKGSYRVVREVSFSVPQRKKLVLEVGGRGLRARKAGTGAVEFGVLWGEIGMVFGVFNSTGAGVTNADTDPVTEHALCVPLPEKAQPQYNFVVFPTGGEEPIVWTVPDGAPKMGVVEGGGADAGTEETYRDLLVRWIEEGREREVVRPGEEGGVGGKGQGWVKGFRGNKDGYLFFLPTGLLWGFKKPLFFFPFALIASVSYTSVLQRTFNLSLTVTSPPPPPSSPSTPPEPPTRDFEFSMLDQLDFASIDAYIRTHGLHDASMAEQRRAKTLNINGVKPPHAKIDAGGADGDGVGELERAEREVRDLEEGDEEEEEDENFDPGSGGESEGSGSSEEEEEEEEEGNGDEGGDLVGEELGSEAEEVDVDGKE